MPLNFNDPKTQEEALRLAQEIGLPSVDVLVDAPDDVRQKFTARLEERLSLKPKTPSRSKPITAGESLKRTAGIALETIAPFLQGINRDPRNVAAMQGAMALGQYLNPPLPESPFSEGIPQFSPSGSFTDIGRLVANFLLPNTIRTAGEIQDKDEIVNRLPELAFDPLTALVGTGAFKAMGRGLGIVGGRSAGTAAPALAKTVSEAAEATERAGFEVLPKQPGESAKPVAPKAKPRKFTKAEQEFEAIPSLRKAEEREAAKQGYENFLKDNQRERFGLPRLQSDALGRQSDIEPAIGIAPQILVKTSANIKTPEGQELAGMLLNADETGKVYAGTYLKEMDEITNPMLGGTKTKLDLSPIQDIIEGKRAPANALEMETASRLHKFLNKMYDHAEVIYKDAGEHLAQFRQNYFPIIYETRKMGKVWDELNRALLSAQQIAEREGLDARDIKVLENILNRRKSADFKFSKEALEFVGHRKSVFNEEIGTAIARGKELTQKELQGIFGSLDRGRKLEFPLSFRVKDPREALIIYIERFAKRIGELETLGKDLEKFKDPLVKLGQTAPDEAAYLQGLLEDLTGATEFTQTKVLGKTFNTPSYKIRNLMGNFSAAEFLTKIAGGFAAAKQVPQTLYSVWAHPNISTRAYLRGLAKSALDARTTDMVKRSGILSSDIYRSATADVAHNWIRTAGEKVGQPFMAGNRVNFYIAASAWNEQLKLWHTAANNPLLKSADRSFAQKMLADLGFDWTKPVLDEMQTLKSMYRFANDSQLQRNVVRDYRWMSNPMFRPLALFKTFDLRQAKWTGDMLKEALRSDKDGELTKTLLKLVVASQVAGEWNRWAVDKLKEAASGKKAYIDFDDNLGKRFIANLVDAGTAGWGTTIGGAIADLLTGGDPEKAVRDIGFVVTPVVVGEGLKLSEEAARFAGDLKADRGLLESVRRAFGRGFYKVSPGINAVFGQPALSVRTTEQERERIKREKSEILQRKFRVSPAIYRKLREAYNLNNPGNPITPEDEVRADMNRRNRPLRRYWENLNLPSGVR